MALTSRLWNPTQAEFKRLKVESEYTRYIRFTNIDLYCHRENFAISLQLDIALPYPRTYASQRHHIRQITGNPPPQNEYHVGYIDLAVAAKIEASLRREDGGANEQYCAELRPAVCSTW